MGEIELTIPQLRAIEILLRKCVPESGGRRDQVRADASLCGGNSAASERRGMAREIQFIIEPGDRLKDDPAVLAGGSKPDGGGVRWLAANPAPTAPLFS